MAIKRSPFAVVLVVLLAGLAFASPAPGDDTLTAEALFERAETLYRQLRSVDPSCADPDAWATLAGVFAEIPQRYPTSALSGDALWRLGDIHTRRLAAGDAGAAVAARSAYSLLVERYPTSDHAASAALRLAELTPTREREAAYVDLLTRYPDSPEAVEARRRLQNRDLTPDPTPSSPVAVEAGPETAAFDAAARPLDEVLEAPPTPASSASSERDPSPAEEAPATPTPAAENETGLAPSSLTFGNVVGVRHFSDKTHTRVVFDLDAELEYEIGEATSPPRVFLDVIGADLPRDVPRDTEVHGTGVERVRMAVNRPGVVRIVLDLKGQGRYSLFHLADPPRIVIDVPSTEMSKRLSEARRPPAPEGGAEARQLALGVHRIVIDPGHGGTAPGAIGRTGIAEKDLTLDISKRLAEKLRASGYDVVLTRTGDTSVELEDRPKMAIELSADLFVSVHINSANNRKLAGFETYYLDLATDPTAAETAARENAASEQGIGNLDDLLDEIVKNANKRESRDLAQSIQDSLVLQMTKDHDDVRDLGVKHAPFVVLVGAHMPAVLVECSFISNSTEESRLREPEYRQGVADSIHIGIENFIARRRMMTDAH